MLNSTITAFANHSISLISGILIFATVYALIPLQAREVITDPGPLNTGLAFIWIPQLFGRLPAASLFSVLFFFALLLASMSSLIAMIELVVRLLNDAGVTRQRAILLVGAVGFAMGVPSALNTSIFLNQDWVWGVGLIVSGAFFTFAVLRFGVGRFRESYINSEDSDLVVGRWYEPLVKVVIPVEVAALIGWWFWVVIQADPGGWWNPFHVESVGTCLFQWGTLILVLIGLNRWIARKTLGVL